MSSRRLAPLLCFGLALLPACSLSRAIAGGGRGHDAGPSDSGLVAHDAGPRTDASLPPRDAWIDPVADAFATEDASVAPLDAFVETPDAFTPEPTPDASVVGPRSCLDIYGDLDGYGACPSMPGQCTFNATLYFVYNCDDACGARGGSCISAFNGSGTDACTSTSDYGCGTRARYAATCICTHVP